MEMYARTTFKARMLFTLFLASTILIVWGTPSHSQTSEKDLQAQEAKDFGIETSSQEEPVSPQPPSDQQLKEQKNINKKQRIVKEVTEETKKTIDAEEFKVKLLKKSKSGKVLLLEDAEENKPKPGKILLLKENETEIGAIRVLKTYPGKFAGKLVLSLNENALGTSYRALKKLGDRIIKLIREQEKLLPESERSVLDEDLANEVTPDDRELDRGIPKPQPITKPTPKPTPTAKVEKKTENQIEPLFDEEGNELEDGEETSPFSDINIQEDYPLEPFRNIISLQYASINGVDASGKTKSRSSIGGRYGYNLVRGMLLRKKTLQDMLTLEGSVFYYNITGFVSIKDSITVFPLTATLRYNLLPSESIIFYGYLGVSKNIVTFDPEYTSSSDVTVLKNTKLVGGAGTLFKIGPNWAIRLDLGTDLFAIGGSLKF